MNHMKARKALINQRFPKKYIRAFPLVNRKIPGCGKKARKSPASGAQRPAFFAATQSRSAAREKEGMSSGSSSAVKKRSSSTSSGWGRRVPS